MTRCLIIVISEGKASCVLNYHPTHRICYLLYTDKFVGLYGNNYIFVLDLKVFCLKESLIDLIGSDIIVFLVSQSHFCIIIIKIFNCGLRIDKVQLLGVFRYYYMPAIGFSAVIVFVYFGIIFLPILLGDGNRCSLNVGIHCGKGCALRNDSGVSALYLCAKGLVAKVYGNKSVDSGGFVYISECGCFFVYPNKLVIGSGGCIAANLEFNGKNQVFRQNSVFSASHSRNNAAGIGFRVGSVRFFGISDHAVIISGKLNIGYFEYFLLKIDVQFIAGNRVAKLRNSKFSRKFIAGFNGCANACNGKCNGRIRKGGNCDNAQNHYRRQQKGQ